MNKLAKIIWSAFSTVICMAFRSEIRAEMYPYVATYSQTTCSSTSCTAACSAMNVCNGSCSNKWRANIDMSTVAVSDTTICSAGKYLFSCASEHMNGTLFASETAWCYGSYTCYDCPDGGTSDRLEVRVGSEQTFFVCSQYSPDGSAGAAKAGVYWKMYRVIMKQRVENENAVVTRCYKKGQDLPATDTAGTYYRNTNCYYSE